MKFRRLAALVLIGTMAVAVTACGTDEPDTTSKREKKRDEDDDEEEEKNYKKNRSLKGDDDEEESEYDDEADWDYDDEYWDDDDEYQDDDTDEDWDGSETDYGEWEVVEWGDLDPDDSCVPTYAVTDVSIDPDDPNAGLYYVWKDMDNDIFDVFIEFFPNGDWESGSDGGESDEGYFDFTDGKHLTLYRGHDIVREFTLNGKGELVAENDGHHYAISGEISPEILLRVMNDDKDPYFEPLQDFYGCWEYEDYSGLQLTLYPDNTWEFSGNGQLMSGDYFISGNSENTALFLRTEDSVEDSWTFRMEGRKLVLYDSDEEVLKRTQKIIP